MHTSIPWEPEGIIHIWITGYLAINHTKDIKKLKEDAQFIAIAVNNHQYLLNALKYSLKLINDKYCAHRDASSCDFCISLVNAIKQAERKD